MPPAAIPTPPPSFLMIRKCPPPLLDNFCAAGTGYFLGFSDSPCRFGARRNSVDGSLSARRNFFPSPVLGKQTHGPGIFFLSSRIDTFFCSRKCEEEGRCQSNYKDKTPPLPQGRQRHSADSYFRHIKECSSKVNLSFLADIPCAVPDVFPPPLASSPSGF